MKPSQTAMPAAAEPASTDACLRIEGEFTIYRASDLCVELLGLLRQPGDLRLDLAEVSEMDTAGAQLLLAARAAAQETRRSLHLVSASEAVREVLQTLGLTSLQAELCAPTAA